MSLFIIFVKFLRTMYNGFMYSLIKDYKDYQLYLKILKNKNFFIVLL